MQPRSFSVGTTDGLEDVRFSTLSVEPDGMRRNRTRSHSYSSARPATPPQAVAPSQPARLALSHTQPLQRPVEFYNKLAALCEELRIENCDADELADEETSALDEFHKEAAFYLHKPAALFVPTSAMAQRVVFAALSEIDREKTQESKGPRSFLVHYSSPLLHKDTQHAIHALSGLVPAVVGAVPADGAELTPLLARDVETALCGEREESKAQENTQARTKTQHAAVVLEMPHRALGGRVTPLEELVALSKLCLTHALHFHMDGGSLWDAARSYDAASLQDVTPLFDSLSLSFEAYGLRGALLLGSEAFLSRCKRWQRLLGGETLSVPALYAPCWAAFRANQEEEVDARRERLQSVARHLTTHLLSKPSCNSVAEELRFDEDELFYNSRNTTSLSFFSANPAPPAVFQPLIRFDPPEPRASMVHVVLDCDLQTARDANALALKHCGIVCFETFSAGTGPYDGKTVSELIIGPSNVDIDVGVWMQGWSTFLAELKALRTAH